MTNHLRASNETAITREQYLELMEGRTRPLTDRYMDNSGAQRWRSEQQACSDRTVAGLDNVIDIAQRVADHRRAEGAA